MHAGRSPDASFVWTCGPGMGMDFAHDHRITSTTRSRPLVLSPDPVGTALYARAAAYRLVDGHGFAGRRSRLRRVAGGDTDGRPARIFGGIAHCRPRRALCDSPTKSGG